MAGFRFSLRIRVLLMLAVGACIALPSPVQADAGYSGEPGAVVQLQLTRRLSGVRGTPPSDPNVETRLELEQLREATASLRKELQEKSDAAGVLRRQLEKLQSESAVPRAESVHAGTRPGARVPEAWSSADSRLSGLLVAVGRYPYWHLVTLAVLVMMVVLPYLVVRLTRKLRYMRLYIASIGIEPPVLEDSLVGVVKPVTGPVVDGDDINPGVDAVAEDEGQSGTAVPLDFARENPAETGDGATDRYPKTIAMPMSQFMEAGEEELPAVEGYGVADRYPKTIAMPMSQFMEAGEEELPAVTADTGLEAGAGVQDAKNDIESELLEVEIYLLYENYDAAKTILKRLITEDDAQLNGLRWWSLRPWTMLFDLYRMQGNQIAFKALSDGFRRRFNIRPPAYVELRSGEVDERSLEQSFPRIMGHIIELWPGIGALDYLNSLLVDDRGGIREGFPLRVAAELAFLRNTLFSMVLESWPEEVGGGVSNQATG